MRSSPPKPVTSLSWWTSALRPDQRLPKTRASLTPQTTLNSSTIAYLNEFITGNDQLILGIVLQRSRSRSRLPLQALLDFRLDVVNSRRRAPRKRFVSGFTSESRCTIGLDRAIWARFVQAVSVCASGKLACSCGSNASDYILTLACDAWLICVSVTTSNVRATNYCSTPPSGGKFEIPFRATHTRQRTREDSRRMPRHLCEHSERLIAVPT